MARISVIVPVFNVEKYLTKCIDSILAQTYKDLEVLCMDDGSTDNSGQILDEYASLDSRIKVIHKKNSGYGDTMNRAIQLATGEYIGIVESDDYIDADMYESLVTIADQYNLDAVKSDFMCFWNNFDGHEYVLYKKLTEKNDYYHCVIDPNVKKEVYLFEKFTWNALYRKDYIIGNNIKHNPTPGASFQDNGFWFQTMYYAKRVMFVDNAFYHYRQDNPNSSVNSDKKLLCMKNEYDYIHDILDKNNELDREYYNICFALRMKGYLFTLEMLSNEKRSVLAQILKEECRYFEYRKEIDWDILSDSENTLIQQICDEPELYVKEKNQRSLNIRAVVAGYKHIVIYGCGVLGKGIYDLVWRNSEKNAIVDYAVSDVNQIKEGYFRSSRVRTIYYYREERDKILIILAVKNNTDMFVEMMNNLVRLEFKNIVSYYDIFEK